MRIVKPQRLSFIHRVFERDNQAYFVATVMAFFDLDAPDALLAEVAMWQALAPYLTDGVVLDEGMPKSRAEVLVSGFAFATEVAAEFVDCSLTIGAVRKSLRVFGDRHWDKLGRVTRAAPPQRIPIDWAHAFGGEGFSLNPTGLGFGYPERVALPNVEDPLALLTAPNQRPAPAGFDALPVDWPQRTRFHGTYDQKWQQERFPGYPDDHDWTFFNTAPDDQWLAGFFEGDEELTIGGMHPSRAVIRSRLPAVQARVFVENADDEAATREIPMRLDTVRVYPELSRGIAIFRGMTPVADDQARDIGRVLVAADRMGAARADAHFLAVLERRRDKETAALEALDDGPLLPAGTPTTVDHTSETDNGAWVIPRGGLLEKHMRAGAQNRLDVLHERMKEQGIDPEKAGVPKELPSPEPAPPLDELGERVAAERDRAERAREQAELRQAQLEKDMRALCDERGLDYDKMRAEADAESGGPPKFSADGKLEGLRDQATLLENAGLDAAPLRLLIDDPALLERLQKAEAGLLDAYRRAAHRFPPGARQDDAHNRGLRADLANARDNHIACDRRDFTGADLSGLDLSGMSFRQALFDNAVMVGCNLRAADLTQAVLSRCDLSRANLADAQLDDANLGQANLSDANLVGATLGGATLTGTDLSRANLQGAKLKRADLSGAVFDDTDLRKANLDRCMVVRCDLRGARLAGVHMQKGVLLECDLTGVDLSDATLDETCFVTVSAPGANFAGAHLHSFRVLKDSNLEAASFRGASMIAANLRGTRLARADLGACDLSQADLSECDLAGADLTDSAGRSSRFERSSLVGAKLVRADLLDAMLPKAKLHGADFSGANLFRCDFAKATGDSQTRFSDANTRFVRIVKGTVDVPS